MAYIATLAPILTSPSHVFHSVSSLYNWRYFVHTSFELSWLITLAPPCSSPSVVLPLLCVNCLIMLNMAQCLSNPTGLCCISSRSNASSPAAVAKNSEPALGASWSSCTCEEVADRGGAKAVAVAMS